MITADELVDATRARGFGLWTGVPCSDLQPLMNCVLGRKDLRYVGAANEGEAVAIAAGSELAGLRAVAMFQNSGLGNAVNPLTSLTHAFRIPVLLVVTWRGQPTGKADEPQHELMGAVTPGLLELLQIPWEPFPEASADVAAVLDRAVTHLETARTPYALVVKRGSIAPFALAPQKLATRAVVAAASAHESASPGLAPTLLRSDVLRAIQAAARPDDIVLASTGFTGRELFALGDLDNQLYMVGSMGCVTSLALGLALAQPDRRVIAIDGDGAALMHLGALAILGHERPANLLHVLVDNGVHESTGGQATVSRTLDFPTIAAGCGYPHVERGGILDDVTSFVKRGGAELSFLHVRVKPGVMADLPRPTTLPFEVADRLRRFLRARS